MSHSCSATEHTHGEPQQFAIFIKLSNGRGFVEITKEKVMVSLNGMSSAALRALAERANSLDEDLERAEPSLALALEAGVRDVSYPTVRCGFVTAFAGQGVIVMADGRRWKAIGHGPQGGPTWIGKQGWVEFIPLDETV